MSQEASPKPAPNAWSRGLQWAARVVFAAALVAAVSRLRPAQPPAGPPVAPLRKVPVAIDWPREPFATWTSVEDGIALEYPTRYDAARAFGKFTSRDIAGGIVENDVVAFRSGEPRSVIVIALYRASKPLSWPEWTALAKTPVPTPAPGSRDPSPFGGEFGGSDKQYREVRQGDRTMLAVSAKGAVKYPIRGNEQMELWRFESRLAAQGSAAVRITAGAHADQWEGTRAGLERTLESFRWTPP